MRGRTPTVTTTATPSESISSTPSTPTQSPTPTPTPTRTPTPTATPSSVADPNPAKLFGAGARALFVLKTNPTQLDLSADELRLVRKVIGPGDCLPYRASRFNCPNDDPAALFQTITYACGQNRAALFVTDNEVPHVIRLNFLAQRDALDRTSIDTWVVRTLLKTLADGKAAAGGTRKASSCSARTRPVIGSSSSGGPAPSDWLLRR